MKPVAKHRVFRIVIKVESASGQKWSNGESNSNVNRGIALTNRCVFSYSCHVIVAYEFWCMIIYVSNSDIYIANGNESTIIGLYIQRGVKKMNNNEQTKKHEHEPFGKNGVNYTLASCCPELKIVCTFTCVEKCVECVFNGKKRTENVI